MTYEDIALEMQENLKQALTNANHVVTGNLRRSVKVKWNSRSKKFSFDFLFYMKYLDEGLFFNDWLKQEMRRIKPLIAEVEASIIREQIKKSLFD